MLVRAISLLLRFVLLLLFVRLLLRFVGGLVRGLRGEPASGRGGRPGAAVDLVRCAVCRTHVPHGRELLVTVAGRELAFCSAACRDQGARAGVPSLPAARAHLE